MRHDSKTARRDGWIVAAIAGMRLSLGIGSIFAPGRSAGMFGVPPEQQTPMGRVVGRWFGVREIVVALLALAGHGGATPIRSRRVRRPGRRERDFVALNAAIDAVDAGAMLVPLIRREGVDRMSVLGLPVAVATSLAWLRLLRST